MPKVKRGTPAGFSRPIEATKRPMKSEAIPFTGRSEVMKTAQVRPRQTSQKYSNELKLSATSASAGAQVTRTIVPKMPPRAEKTRPAPSATSARPFLVMA
jgi:hypothetical protein